MKKLVLILFVLTAFAFGVKGQSSTATDASSDAANQSKASGIRVNSEGSQPTSVEDQKSSEPSKSLPVEKKGCFKISSLSLASGVNKYRSMGRFDKDNDRDFDKPSKGSNHMNFGSMNFMGGKNNVNTISRNSVIVEMGLNPWSKKMGDYNKKRELIVSLFFSGSNLEDHKSMKFASTPGDTFSLNTIKYQTDTVSLTRHSVVERANVLGAGVQYLFKSDPEKRISLFTGVGINASYALTARIEERYTKDSAVLLGFSGQNYNNIGLNEFDKGNFLGSEETKTSIKADPTMFADVFIPFGVNLRLCKKKDIWNQMNLFIKGSLGLETEIEVNHSTHFNPYMGCAMGFKFDFK